MVPSVSVLTGFDSLSRFTDTSYYGQFALSLRKESPYNLDIIMHAKFILKKMFLSRFTLHPSPFSFPSHRSDSFMKVIDL